MLLFLSLSSLFFLSHTLTIKKNQLIDQSTLNRINSAYGKCKQYLDKGDMSAANDVCPECMQYVLESAGNINVYDIRSQCTFPPLCYDMSHVTDALNNDTLKQMLGVPRSQQWAPCNDKVPFYFHGVWCVCVCVCICVNFAFSLLSLRHFDFVVYPPTQLSLLFLHSFSVRSNKNSRTFFLGAQLV